MVQGGGWRPRGPPSLTREPKFLLLISHSDLQLSNESEILEVILMFMSSILIFLCHLLIVFVSQEIIKTFNITKPMIPPRPNMNHVVNGNQNDDGDEEEEEEDDN